MNVTLYGLSVWVLPLLIAITFHEAAHGLVAWRLGDDTAYKLGRAYENLGDLRRAAIYYEEVTTFTEHPLYYEARDALDRVKRGGAPAAL